MYAQDEACKIPAEPVGRGQEAARSPVALGEVRREADTVLCVLQAVVPGA